LDLGISLSPTAITDPELLLECLEEAFDELTAPFADAGRPAPAPAGVEVVEVVDGVRGDAPANGSSNAGLRHG
jgi:hypothetical protein